MSEETVTYPSYSLEELKYTLHKRSYYGDSLWYHRVEEWEAKIEETVRAYAERNNVSYKIALGVYNLQVRLADQEVENAENNWGVSVTS